MTCSVDIPGLLFSEEKQKSGSGGEDICGGNWEEWKEGKLWLESIV